jgi:hypothetical protein
MSINSALLAGVSGLSANSAALAAISQNIANVNTIGYKRVASEFSTVVNSQTRGAGYSAGGVLSNTRNYISPGRPAAAHDRVDRPRHLGLGLLRHHPEGRGPGRDRPAPVHPRRRLPRR